MSNLIRWHWRPVDEQNFDTMMANWPRQMRNRWSQDYDYESDTAFPTLRPAMDVKENDNNVLVTLDLPGMKPDDVDIELNGEMLTISGELGDTIEDEKDQYHYRERRFGRFRRTLRLSDIIDADQINADFHNGVLTLTLPKKEERQPKRIEIAHNA